MTSDDTQNGPPANTESDARKKVKTDVLLKDVVSETILAQDRATLRREHRHTEPYLHGVLPDLFQADWLMRVISEIKSQTNVDFKESDLFKVYQSIDLANLDQHPGKEKMPSAMQLRSLLYSREWRRFMEDLNDLEPDSLSEQVDCACNCHMNGCHLLCHDDVIGTRKISYILYLTEPDPEWKTDEGGALELYDSRVDGSRKGEGDGPHRIPETIPSKALLPIFNHMAFFVVEPGKSFHAVQEVFSDRPRLSMQGWYHVTEAPVNAEHATLNRLKSYQGKDASKAEDTEGEFEPYADTDEELNSVKNVPAAVKSLTPSDRDFLAQWIQPTYLAETSIAEIRKKFEEESSIQLRNFLLEDWQELLEAATADEHRIRMTDDVPLKDYYQLGVSDAWQTVGPPHKQRFLEYTTNDITSSTTAEVPLPADQVGEKLLQVRTRLLQSPVFGRYLSLLTSLEPPLSHRGRVRRFRPGRDYTVAHYGLLSESSVLDATLCFVAKPREEGTATDTNKEEEATSSNEEEGEVEAAWNSGDCGGFECYIAADEEDEDDAEALDEYNADDDTELLSVSASNNTLSLVYRNPGTMRFIKYVGLKAPSSRWDIAMEYAVPQEDDESGKSNEGRTP